MAEIQDNFGSHKTVIIGPTENRYQSNLREAQTPTVLAPFSASQFFRCS